MKLRYFWLVQLSTTKFATSSNGKAFLFCIYYDVFSYHDAKFTTITQLVNIFSRACSGIDMDSAWGCGNKDNGVILRDPAARLNHSAPRAAE